MTCLEQQASTSSTKPKPFGKAAPREDVLIRKGVDQKAMDEKIEAKVACTSRLLTDQRNLHIESEYAEVDGKKQEMDVLLAKFNGISIDKEVKDIHPGRRTQRVLDRSGGGGYGYQGGRFGWGGGKHHCNSLHRAINDSSTDSAALIAIKQVFAIDPNIDPNLQDEVPPSFLFYIHARYHTYI